jgi:glycosyltransferase involved in cell wall biosynthesis
MKSPRILQLNSLLNGGGTDDHCLKLAGALRSRQANVWILGPANHLLSPEAANLKVPLAPLHPGFGKLRLIWQSARLIRQLQINILHAHHGRDYWPAILAARLTAPRPRIVLTRHLAKSPGSWASRHFLLGQCDAFIAVSEFVAQVLREGVYEPDSPEPERRRRVPMRGDCRKIRVILGGMDTDRFKPTPAETQRQAWGLARDHYAFAVVGSYDRPRGKGQREFLLAAARIHQQSPQARFLVVGRGNLQAELEADIQRLKLMGKAWLTPYCQDMPAAMNAIDCLVHPQVGTEALGLVVGEALACGRPVIASAIDGIPEAFRVGQYGRLVKPESVDELADAMRHWAQQPPLSESQRWAMHEQVARQLGLARMAQETLELYETLLYEQRA